MKPTWGAFKKTLDKFLLQSNLCEDCVNVSITLIGGERGKEPALVLTTQSGDFALVTYSANGILESFLAEDFTEIDYGPN